MEQVEQKQITLGVLSLRGLWKYMSEIAKRRSIYSGIVLNCVEWEQNMCDLSQSHTRLSLLGLGLLRSSGRN
jgi:hypothetical protein